MTADDTRLDIRAFKDFRQFIQARYRELKELDPKFSHRYFCRRAGYSSTGAFADLVNGRRNLTPTGALKLAKALHLNRADEEFFLTLVGFNQSGSLEEKNLHYAKLLAYRRIRPDRLSPDRYEYFSKWYHAALRELLYFHPFHGDYKELGRRLDPSLPASTTRKAIATLERLGMIARDVDGRYRQTSKIVSSEDAGESLHVDNFQAETMRLAIDALDRVPRAKRDFSTLTATLSEESLEKVKAALSVLRSTVLTLAEQDEKVDRVYQLNLQLFPLSK